MRDNAARLLVSGWREYNIYMYIRRIVVPVKNYDIIYIYIYKHDRCCCWCFQNSRACSSRFACACAAACKHPTSLIFARSMPNDSGSSGQRNNFSPGGVLVLYFIQRHRAFVSMEFRTEPRISTEIDVSNYYPIASTVVIISITSINWYRLLVEA